jgi:hypothetical protein
MFTLDGAEALKVVSVALSEAHIAKKRGEPLGKSSKFEREKLANRQAQLWHKEAQQVLGGLLAMAATFEQQEAA